MPISALQAAQLSAALSAATTNFSPGPTPQTRFADNLLVGAQQTIEAENRKKLAKMAKKGNGFIDTARHIAGAIPGPQQPFVMGANAVYDASQGNYGAAIQGAAGAGMGFANQYGGGGVAPGTEYGTPDPLYSPAVQATPLAAPAAAAPAAPATPPPGTGTVLAPKAAPAAATPAPAAPGPMASGYVPAAPSAAAPAAPTPAGGSNILPVVAGASAAALAGRMLNPPQKAPSGPAQPATIPGSSATLPAMANNRVIQSMESLKPGQMKNVRTDLLLPTYLQAKRAAGQKVPMATWRALPPQERAKYKNDPAYAGIVPTRSDLVNYLIGGIAGAAVGAGVSQLIPGEGGVYNYVPGG